MDARPGTTVTRKPSVCCVIRAIFDSTYCGTPNELMLLWKFAVGGKEFENVLVMSFP